MLGLSLKWLRNGPGHSFGRIQRAALSAPRLHTCSVALHRRGLASSSNCRTPQPPHVGVGKLGSTRGVGYSGALFLVATVASGIAGYTIAHAQQALTPTPTKSDATQEPQYGSPEEFKRGIEDLKQAFPSDDIVSTDSEDLHHHGFSVYDYHPGMRRRESRLNPLHTQTAVRFFSQRDCVPRVNRRRGEDCQNRDQV
jgi:hypothetical protein